MQNLGDRCWPAQIISGPALQWRQPLLLAHLGNAPTSGLEATEQLTRGLRLIRGPQERLEPADSSDERLIHGAAFLI